MLEDTLGKMQGEKLRGGERKRESGKGAEQREAKPISGEDKKQ